MLHKFCSTQLIYNLKAITRSKSDSDLARKIGVSRGTISNLKKGTPCSVNTAVTIAEGLSVVTNKQVRASEIVALGEITPEVNNGNTN